VLHGAGSRSHSASDTYDTIFNRAITFTGDTFDTCYTMAIIQAISKTPVVQLILIKALMITELFRIQVIPVILGYKKYSLMIPLKFLQLIL